MDIVEFERMRDIAELKVLSKLSLKRPLEENEFKRAIELKRKWL